MTDTPTDHKTTVESLELVLDKAIVEPALQAYWNQYKDKLPETLIRAATKGGYRHPPRDRVVKLSGGLATFYQPVFTQIIRDHLKAQKKSTLLIDFIVVEEGISSYTLNTRFCPEPVVIWKQGSPPGITSPLTIKMPKHPDKILQDLVQNQLAQIREQAVILIPEADGASVQPDMVVSISAKSIIDLQPWAQGTFEDNKWLMRPETFRIPEMYEALLDMVHGETTVVNITLNEQFTPEMRGKKGMVQLTVNQIYKREIPDDLELAKIHGVSTYAELITKITKQVTEEWKSTRDEMVFQSCLTELCKSDLVTVDLLPVQWLTQKAQDLYLHYLGISKSESELIKHFKTRAGTDNKIEDKRSLLVFFMGQIARQFIFDLLVKSWGKAKNVPGGEDLELLNDYVQAVKPILCNSVNIEETN